MPCKIIEPRICPTQNIKENVTYWSSSFKFIQYPLHMYIWYEETNTIYTIYQHLFCYLIIILIFFSDWVMALIAKLDCVLHEQLFFELKYVVMSHCAYFFLATHVHLLELRTLFSSIVLFTDYIKIRYMNVHLPQGKVLFISFPWLQSTSQ